MTDFTVLGRFHAVCIGPDSLIWMGMYQFTHEEKCHETDGIR